MIPGCSNLSENLLYKIETGRMVRSSVALNSDFPHFAFVVLEGRYQHVIYDGKLQKNTREQDLELCGLSETGCYILQKTIRDGSSWITEKGFYFRQNDVIFYTG